MLPHAFPCFSLLSLAGPCLFMCFHASPCLFMIPMLFILSHAFPFTNPSLALEYARNWQATFATTCYIYCNGPSITSQPVKSQQVSRCTCAPLHGYNCTHAVNACSRTMAPYYASGESRGRDLSEHQAHQGRGKEGRHNWMCSTRASSDISLHPSILLPVRQTGKSSEKVHQMQQQQQQQQSPKTLVLPSVLGSE